jgi:hypothetical protein
MNHIYLALTLALLLLNLAGVTLITRRWLPPHALARSVGILLICLVLFFIEHFIGLGRLTWVWPITTLLSLALLYRQRAQLPASGFWRAEGVFYLAFFYVFAWKFAFPTLYPSSERVTDLYFIANYLDGSRLPPLDHWFPPHVFNVYYAFQHYAASLMGRIFGLDPGYTYNIAFPLLLALPMTLAWEFAGRYVRRPAAKWLLLVALVSGGTGISPLTHLIIRSQDPLPAANIEADASDRMLTSQRFSGVLDQRINTPLGETLFPHLKPQQKPTPDFEPRELQMESYGYQIFLGDYHPPLGGYFLLLLALALIGAIEARAVGRMGQAVLAATLPVVMVTNTWVFPLQGLLIMGWIAYRYWQKNPPDWVWLVGGGLAALALVYPFLSDFALNAQNTPIRLTAAADHTPLDRFIGQHWPLLVLMLLALLNPGTRKLSITLAITFGLILLISEFFYVDDPTGGKYQRSNTTMKWWGWVWCGGLVGLGALCLGSGARFVRWTAGITLLLVSVYAYDVARYYVVAGKGDLGHLSGHHWLTQDPAARDMLHYLKHAPTGIVLENEYGNAYTNTSLYALFSGKPVLLGWPLHLLTWRGDVPDVWALNTQIQAFYAGTLPDSLDWLLANQVRYVVWSGAENGKDPQVFDRLQQQIGSRYLWKPFYAAGDYRVGLWLRLP